MKKAICFFVLILFTVGLFPGIPASRLQRQKDRLTGKVCKAMFQVIDDEAVKHHDYFLVFLFSGFDCQPCIKDGFRFARQAEDDFHEIYLVGSNANVGMLQLRYDYHRFIYNDVKEIIRKELKYILTPVFLLLNKKGEIVSIHYVIRGSWEQEKNVLLNKLKSL